MMPVQTNIAGVDAKTRLLEGYQPAKPAKGWSEKILGIVLGLDGLDAFARRSWTIPVECQNKPNAPQYAMARKALIIAEIAAVTFVSLAAIAMGVAVLSMHPLSVPIGLAVALTVSLGVLSARGLVLSCISKQFTKWHKNVDQMYHGYNSPKL